MRRDEFPIVDAYVKQEINKTLEDIKAEIDGHCSDNRDRNDGLYIAMKIIDKHIGTCDTCNTPCVMYEKGMKGCGKENE